MTTYRCRVSAPKVGEWRLVEADSPGDAAQILHDQDQRNGVAFWPDPAALPGNRILFARVEVEGHDSMVSRIYMSNIVRRGGVKPRRPTLAEVAKAIGWDRDPEDLLAPGWVGEEPES